MQIIKLLFFIFTMSIFSPRNSQDKFDLLIGTYTSEGIYVYTFDSKTGKLAYKNKAIGIDNPSYLTISPDKKNVYAISEFGSDPIGMVYAYHYDALTGELTFENKESAGGNGPCYVSTDRTGKYVFTANYGSGSLAAIPVMSDGSFGSTVQEIYNAGKWVDGKEAPSRMHSAVISPDNKYLFAPNLGIDKIGVYKFNSEASSNPLESSDPELISMPEGSGPRHFVFHPNGKHAYVIQEKDGGITVFDYHKGTIQAKQNVSILPPDFRGKFAAADIHISPDGKFLYASNRIDINEIIIYSIHQKSGKLTHVGNEASMGINPRNFAIDPTGSFLLVANQNTNNIVVFKRNKKSGLLSPTEINLQINRPVCLKFVH